ncbi:MAG: type II toxin-antitoxin system RelE/ParE family toxin [Hyphomicrobiales bacterium]|nr:type II toxin-antitoxin system RelE/ParE family toxin [Hyphomicrobiales bacterium]
MKLVWSPEALDDLVSIRQFISSDSPGVARDVVAAIVRVVQERLSTHPHSGRKGRVDGTYELVIPRLPFVVPYAINGDTVEIIRVYHTSRKWPERF